MKLNEMITFVFGLLGVGMLGIADYYTGGQISFSIFYLIPIYIIAWRTNRFYGVVLSLIAAAVWMKADLSAGGTYSNFLIPAWNSFVRFGFFIIVVFLATGLRKEMKLEKELARVDPLTKIYNRRAFYDVALAEIHRDERLHNPITVVYIDLDNFKGVNDALGHDVGDDLLFETARVITEGKRKSDTCARFGGDEFVLLLPGMKPDSLENFIRKIQNELLFEMKQREWPVTFSIGSVTFIKKPSSVEEMVTAADNLMYEVKKSGKNAYKHKIIQ